jgi:hypothetical protein
MNKFLIAFLLMITPLASQALFEVRAGYGSLTTDEDTYQGGNLDKLTGFNLDFIFEPPLFTDLGFGVRYEKLSMDIGSNAEADLDRISALINYRFIDLIAYFGLIGSIGLSNDLSVQAGSVTTDYDAKLNYSIGIEGGMSLGLIQVGAEVGKFFGEFENNANADLDLSGIYGKVLVGFGF